MRAIIKSIILIIICVSCKQAKDIVDYSLLNEPIDTLRLKFNGFYNVLDRSIIKIRDCENSFEESSGIIKRIDEIVLKNKKDKKRDSIISAVKIKNCEENGKKRSDMFTSISPVILSINRRIIVDNGSFKDSMQFDCSYYKNLNDFFKETKINKIGYYQIKGDSIYASLPTYFISRGMIYRLRQANYRGYIKNRDTITDWKVVSPYPIKIGKFEERFNANSHLLEPQTLYFVKTDAVKCLDMGSSNP